MISFEDFNDEENNESSDEKQEESEAEEEQEEKPVDNIEDDAARVEECVTKLRELLQGEEDLKVKTDDKFLLRYLRWVGFRPEVAFHKMKKFYKFKAENKTWFCASPPSEYETELELCVGAMLADRDSKGRRIYLVKLENVDTNMLTVETVSHMDDLWLETIMDEEETQKNGLVILLDLAGYSWTMFSWITPHNSRIACLKALNVTLRNVEIHIVNSSFLLNATIALVHPFLDPRIRQQIYFHGQDWDSLHEKVNPEVLPEEYGGTGPSVDYDFLRKKMYDKSDYLMEIFSLGYVNRE